jgi:hypothetical protein
MNINANTKLLILAVLLLSIISSFFYFQTIQEDSIRSYKSYEKTANEISIISKLKNYYGSKKTNKRKVHTIINKYKSQLVNKKENKNSIEFTITKLNHSQLDTVNREILNSGVNVLQLTITKLDTQTGKLFCKVLF